MPRRHLFAVTLCLAGLSSALFAQNPETQTPGAAMDAPIDTAPIMQDLTQYRIDSVEYDIKGTTKKYPLSLAVPIDQKKIYVGLSAFEFYVADLEIQFRNQRVLESANIDAEYGQPGPDGVIPVKLTVHTRDTWNIIALPKPSFDSNSGFELKLKLKNYNFFGSMQPLDADIAYGIDNDGQSTLETSLGFDIPFQFHSFDLKWKNDFSIEIPDGEIPEFKISSGFDLSLPVTSFAKVVFSLDNKLDINDRTTDTLYANTPEEEDVTRMYKNDAVYLNESFEIQFPITFYSSTTIGDIQWTPYSSVSRNFDPVDGKMDDSDLDGTTFSWGHGFSIGRVNWHGNFRHGLSASLSNGYSYNINTDDSTNSVTANVKGYWSFADRIGFYTHFIGFKYLSDDTSDNNGDELRGILDKRVDGLDEYLNFNFDMPVKIMDVDFEEITGVHWTKFIGFEMQASPFFDMMLTHDPETGRVFSTKDGWYSGGIELIVYPKKMRSIYGRISLGFDLGDMAENGWKMESTASRDGESTKELFIGIGLQY